MNKIDKLKKTIAYIIIGFLVILAIRSYREDYNTFKNRDVEQTQNAVSVNEDPTNDPIDQSIPHRDIKKLEAEGSTNENSVNEVLSTKNQSNFQYQLYEENIEDIPVKTAVERVLLLEKPNQDKEAIRRLLSNQYQEMIHSTGYKYHQHPSFVVAYLYETKEHYQAGAGQWIAQVIQSPGDSTPQYNFLDRYFSKKQAKSKNLSRFSETKRRKIWIELIQAEWDAEKEAFDKYPYTVDHPRYQKGNNDKNMEYFDKRSIELQDAVRKKYNLPPETESAIRDEAYEKNWPLPPQPSYDY